MRYFRFLLFFIMCQVAWGCATWYQRTMAFQEVVGKGEFGQAEKILQKDKKQAQKKNRILYCLNQGYVNFMLGRYELSNQFFDMADVSRKTNKGIFLLKLPCWFQIPKYVRINRRILK